MAKFEDVDVITGDWMSECNMTLRGADKRDKIANKSTNSVGYEPSFVEKLDPAIPWLVKKGTKVAVNAGASDVAGLAEAVKVLVEKHGVDLRVAYVDGDDVTDAFMELYEKGEPGKSILSPSADTDRRAIPKPPTEQVYSGLGQRTNRGAMLPRRHGSRGLFRSRS
jgi:hypothetical protein